MSNDVLPIPEVGVIGAGVMGAAIAAEHVRHGFPVTICDICGEALRGVCSAIESILNCTQDVSGMPSAPLATSAAVASEDIRRHICLTSDLARLGQCDLVIESIGETVATKQRLYSQLQPHLSTSAILASNTSTIPIAKLSAGLPCPERFCGMHFFHPVAKRPLVEVICSPDTSKATVNRVVGHVQSLKRRAIVAQDGPGFIVNRLLFPHLAEALTMLCEGVAPEAIEQAAADFGMAMGPLRLMDEIGLDTTLQAGWILAMAFPERIVASPLLVTMVKAKQLGCKSGVGFFVYGEGAGETCAPGLNPLLAARIAKWAVAGPAKTQTPQAIADRLLLPMVCEAARILEEGRVAGPEEIDAGAVLGLGFPPSRGGLLEWADTLGASEIVRRLRSLDGNAVRYQPPPLLAKLASRKVGFFQ